MPVSDDFLEYILDQFSDWGQVAPKRMFGGVGLFRYGKMFGLIINDTPYFKVDETNKQKYIDAGSHPFKPYDDKPMVMSYYELPPAVLENPNQLAEWAEESIDIQMKK